MKKIIVPVLFFCIFAVFPVNAANVSFLIIENGLPVGNQSSEYSIIWENGFFDILYDLGHIISNIPIMQVYEKPDENLPYEAERDFEEAKARGMDFFIIAILDYPPARRGAPQNVVLRLFSTKSKDMIYEQIYSGTTPMSVRDKKYENVKEAITEFASRLIIEINLRR